VTSSVETTIRASAVPTDARSSVPARLRDLQVAGHLHPEPGGVLLDRHYGDAFVVQRSNHTGTDLAQSHHDVMPGNRLVQPAGLPL
jgi:hypothetical protein